MRRTLLAFVALALSAYAQAPAPFGVISARSGSPVHLMPWNANGGTFWLGKDTASFCPVPTVPPEACPPGTSTVFEGGDPTLNLDVEVPGGQQVFVQTNGLLGFTVAHSGQIPPGATIAGFSWTGSAAEGDLGFSAFGATGFVACPTNGTAPYQIYADVAGGDWEECLSFDALTFEYTESEFGAWEYT